ERRRAPCRTLIARTKVEIGCLFLLSRVSSSFGRSRNMAISTRRDFILFCGAVSVGSVVRGNTTPATSVPPRVVRAPAVGQSWRYAKHDYFNGIIVDTQIDRVSKVDKSIEIESR